ncbi:TRAF3-interacting protein 1 [Anopheles marshallii]|uniref:TRAF3-interacting protein 1 n=1 Tax=Anopheles marshallii TaxID=1521116 RepID=UPI00237BDBF8|nr:TRAF3-interacting protein 1 [Anopheles marshallii]
MASELDATVLKKTQSSLGKFVKRPALTDKLLRKPPFRFLHDIVHAIIREHGLLDGLYTVDELNSDNIKDRDSKMAFLQKLIDVVKLTTGLELKVRPSKIVAGLEPERTNELLQAVASALEEKLSTADIVRQYLGDNAKVNGTTNGSTNGVPETNGTTKVETREDKKAKHEKTKEKPKEREEKQTVGDKRKDRTAKVGKEKDVSKNASSVQQPESRTEKGKSKPTGTKVANDAGKKKPDKPSKGKEKTLKRISSIPEEQLPTVVPVRPDPITNGAETVANGTTHDGRKRKDSLKEFGESVTMVDANGEDNAVPSADEEHEKRKQQPGSNSSSRRSSLKKQNSLTASENNALSEMNQFNGLHSSLSRQDSGGMMAPDGPGLDEAGSADVAPNRTPEVLVTVTPNESKPTTKPAIHRQQSVETVMRPRTSLRPPSVRPPSARPGAPRRKEKNVEVILQPNETQKLGEINVKMEVFNSELLDDDGENLIVIEDPSTVTDDIVYGRMTQDPSGATEETATQQLLQSAEQEEQQGHLVQQILETQKEFSTHTGTDSEMLRKADMEWTAGQRQSSAKQMESLRESIQKLTRSVNPLGKLMDFIQEDIDSMERELASWQQIYTQSMVELNKERSATENAIEPLKQQLQQIEVNIKEYREMIDTTRGNILQNEQKIERLYMTEI